MLTVNWRRDDPLALRRPVYLPDEHSAESHIGLIPVNIDEGGLLATGYLLARSEVIYPAELRGITIRVRNVAIGDASFLGWEHILSGPRKAALSQITGEITVLNGLDTSDAINPGPRKFLRRERPLSNSAESTVRFRGIDRRIRGSSRSRHTGSNSCEIAGVRQAGLR